MNLYNINHKDPNMFVISLDAIDLNYIPTTLNRSYHDKVTPIWTKGNLDLRNNEYFEFEIKSKEDSLSITEEETTDDIIEYTICHICDINVPKPYLNEHNMSIKHRTHKKVIEIALDRTKRNINHGNVIQNIKQNNQAYFCTSCVAVINLKDKKEHESSVIHKNSIIVDKILQDFLILYSNNESHNLDDTENCIESTVRIQNNDTKDLVQIANADKVADIKKNKFVIDCFAQNLINNSNINEKTLKAMSDEDLLQTLININDNFKKADINHETGRTLKENEVKTVEDDKQDGHSIDDMKRYLEVINNIYCIKIDITVIDNINLEISTLEGSCVKVPTNNFLGLKNIDKNHFQCLLCQEVIKSKLKEQHIYGNLHMKTVSTLFKDKHCVRIIDLSWSHCVICNLLIENSDLHVLCNEEHIRLLSGALVSDVEETHTPIPLSLYQNNAKVDASTLKHNSVVKVTGENSHLLWADKVKGSGNVGSAVQAQSKEITCKDDDLEHNEQEDIAVSNNPIKYCVICEIDVLSENLKVHLLSTRHKINTEIKNLEVHYLMEIINQEELKCLICFCPVKRNSAAVQRHLLSKNHVKLYNKLILDNNMRYLKNCKFFCLLCKVQVSKIDELSHINGTGHRKAVEENVLANVPNGDIEPLDADNQYLCDVCNVHVPDTKTCIYIHNSGAKHLKNVRQLTTKSGDSVTNSTGMSSTESIQSNGLFELHYHMTLTKESDNLYCIVCDVNVTLHEKNMHQHINGNNHKAKYSHLLEINHLILDNNTFSCKLCLINIDDKQELIHCKSRKHHKSLELHRKSISVDKNKTITTVDNKFQDQIKDISDKSVCNQMANLSLKPSASVDITQPSTSTNLLETNKALKRYLLQPTESLNTLICIVCNVKVPNNESNIATYLNGRGHCNNYNAVIKQNSLIELENYFKCGLCEVTIPKGIELIHINDVQHKLYVGKSEEGRGDAAEENVKLENIYKCSICNVKLTNSEANITEHNIGSHHVQKVKLFTENKLTFKSGVVYCEICELGFPQSDIWEHIETKRHIIAKHFS